MQIQVEPASIWAWTRLKSGLDPGQTEPKLGEFQPVQNHIQFWTTTMLDQSHSHSDQNLTIADSHPTWSRQEQVQN